jgi:hypothetical protein
VSCKCWITLYNLITGYIHKISRKSSHPSVKKMALRTDLSLPAFGQELMVSNWEKLWHQMMKVKQGGGKLR